MSINDRITEIREYFKEMQVRSVDNKQIIYVIVKLPSGWVIDSTVEQEYHVSVLQLERQNEYAFCCEIEYGEEEVFNAIIFCIKKMQNAIERAKLLAEKTKELKELFSDENTPIEKLKQLTFTFMDTSDTFLPQNPSIIQEMVSGVRITDEKEENKKKEEKNVKNE
jgi:hypothetical protein